VDKDSIVSPMNMLKSQGGTLLSAVKRRLMPDGDVAEEGIKMTIAKSRRMTDRPLSEEERGRLMSLSASFNNMSWPFRYDFGMACWC